MSEKQTAEIISLQVENKRLEGELSHTILEATSRLNNALYETKVENTRLHAEVEQLRVRLDDTTNWVETFICQCEPETGNVPCARCYIVQENRIALALPVAPSAEAKKAME